MNKPSCVPLRHHLQNQAAGQSLQTPGLELEFSEQQSPRVSSVLDLQKFQLPNSELPFPPLARDEPSRFALCRLRSRLNSLTPSTYFQHLSSSTWGLESSLTWFPARTPMSFLQSVLGSSSPLRNQTEHGSIFQMLLGSLLTSS